MLFHRRFNFLHHNVDRLLLSDSPLKYFRACDAVSLRCFSFAMFHSCINIRHDNMCKLSHDNIINSFEAVLPEVRPRSYRKPMKPRLPRKITASARINLNRFWNELEEFYNRYDERTEKPVVKMPAYTTDTYDHDREAAENNLNEAIEIEAVKLPQPPTATTLLLRPPPISDRVRLQSGDVDIEVSSEDSEEDDDVFTQPHHQPLTRALWNVFPSHGQPERPPRTLLDLIQRMGV